MTAVDDLVGPVHVVTAFAASLDARSAVRKAVEELEGNRYAIPDRFDVPETPASLTDRFFYWQRADRLDELAFWLEPGHEVALERAEQPATPYERLQALVARVQRIGLEVYFLDLTPPELAELPLAVVAAIIPGTVSLATPYRPCHLAAKRLGSGPFNALPCPIW
jgi:ribosomal protein S12 methylthiotransferase accessory factor YcaO